MYLITARLVSQDGVDKTDTIINVRDMVTVVDCTEPGGPEQSGIMYRNFTMIVHEPKESLIKKIEKVYREILFLETPEEEGGTE